MTLTFDLLFILTIFNIGESHVLHGPPNLQKHLVFFHLFYTANSRETQTDCPTSETKGIQCPEIIENSGKHSFTSLFTSVERSLYLRNISREVCVSNKHQ